MRISLYTIITSLALVISVSSLVIAQESGTIAGNVIDAETGEELIGATVLVQETSQGTVTDISGNYQLSLQPGTYRIQYSYVSYSPKTVENVEIVAGESNRIDISLQSDDVQLQEVVVQAAQINNNETALLKLQQKSFAVQDGISIGQIRRIGASNSAESMKNVTGASVEEGKYVVIRGLGDRYTNTQLNGVTLPSTDPYRNTASLDLIPSSIVENIVTLKTFTPDQPGSFAGGNVDVTTRSIPEQFFVSARVSVKYNDQASFKDILTDPISGDLDWLGYGRDARELPDFLAQNRDALVGTSTTIIRARSGEDETSQNARNLLEGSTSALENRSFIPVTEQAGLGYRLQLSVGDRKTVFGKNFGYAVGINYLRDYSNYTNRIFNRWDFPPAGQETLEVNLNTQGQSSSENATLGGIVNLAYQLDNRNEIKALYTYNNDTQIQAGMLSGAWPAALSGNRTLFTDNVAYIQRTVGNAQLEGKHSFGLKNYQVNWLFGYTSSDQFEPDTRVFAYDEQNNDNTAAISSGEYDNPFHFFRSLEDRQFSGKVDIEIPLGQESNHRIKFGALAREKTRDFEELRFQINNSSLRYSGNSFTSFTEAAASGDIGAYFAPSNTGVIGGPNENGFYRIGPYYTNATKSTNIYSGTERVVAGYAMGVYQVTSALKFIGGVRAESTFIEVVSADSSTATGNIKALDFLPSLNAVYALNDKSNLRIAGSRTLARPNMREIASFESFDFIGGFIYKGNPNLDRSLVWNLDLRYEVFPKAGELIAVSAFYKFFNDPIQVTLNQRASDARVSYVNVDEAQLYGIELELRKNLGFIGGRFAENLQFGTNFTYTRSQVDLTQEEIEARQTFSDNVETTRPFQAQSPYIVNVSLTYYNPESELEATIYANAFGRRLFFNGFRGVPDTYEINGNGNIPTPDLRFTVNKRIFEKFTLGFKAENILDYQIQRNVEYPQGSGEYFIQEQFNPGRTFTLSVGYGIGD